MRLDKFLKTARLIKRRTVAKEACDQGRVALNGRPARPGALVKPGDVVAVRYGGHTLVVEVVVAGPRGPRDAAEWYRVVESRRPALEDPTGPDPG